MAVTRLKRKKLKNIVKSKVRKETMKRLIAMPTIKNVDVDAIKLTFAAKV